MKKGIVLSLIVVLLNSTFAFGQADAKRDLATDLDAFVRKSMDKIADVPALAIVVIKDDKPIFTRAYGIADKEAGRKADENTLFYMGSSTKSFTALVAAMIDKEGKIKLNDPVTRYTAGIQFKNAIPERVIVRDLLTHTSGLQNSPLIHRTAYTGYIDKKDIDRVFADGTRFDENWYGKYRYTNLGYNIYGLLLENNLKLKWQDEIQKRIFDPAGLTHSTTYRSRAAAKELSFAAPYVFEDHAGGIVRSKLDKFDNNMQAAGGHFMSITDLGKWLNLNMNGGKLKGKQVIPNDLLTFVHTGYTKSTRNDPPFSGDGDYGLGWQIGKYRDEKVIYHHGGYNGYRSHVSYMPDKKIAVGVLVNNDMAGGRLADMVAVYAYDWLNNTPNFEAEFAKQLDDLATQWERRKQGSIAAAAERAKRVSQLTLPHDAYSGKYYNDLLGTIEILPEGNTLVVRMGNLYAVSTPYTQKDSIRVVMTPGADGEIIGFTKDESNKIVSLNYGNFIFTRVT